MSRWNRPAEHSTNVCRRLHRSWEMRPADVAYIVTIRFAVPRAKARIPHEFSFFFIPAKIIAALDCYQLSYPCSIDLPNVLQWNRCNETSGIAKLARIDQPPPNYPVTLRKLWPRV